MSVESTGRRRAAARAALAGLWLAAGALAQDFHVDVKLEPGHVIGLDELATLSVRVDSVAGRALGPAPRFEVDNFRIAAGPSKANSLRFSGGVSSRSLTFTWHLQPLAVGTARVHSGVLEIGGERIELPARSVEVTETAPRGRQQRRPRDPWSDPFFSDDPFEELIDARRSRRQRRRPAAPPKIYLSAEVHPRDPYVGEQALYTLYLFTQVDVRSVNPEELPDFRGFWSRVIPQPDQLEPQMLYLGGERIYKVVLLQRALFARRAGRIEIGPVEARMNAAMPDPGPFGSLLPRPKEIVRKSNAVDVDVLELPPPPAGFQGAVGQLKATAELAPAEIEVGEAATLSLTLAGKGHLQGLPPPLLPEIEGVEIFEPQQRSSEEVRHKDVAGERTWSFVLVPQRPGRWRLPPIEIPYFDPRPRQQRYRTAGAPALDLTVRPAAADDGGRTADHEPDRAALPVDGSAPSSWRLALLGLPLGGLVAVAWWLRRRTGHGGGERRRLLGHLASAAGEPRPRRAAAQIEEAWREFLHRRWEVPQGSPSTRWSHILVARGAREDAADKLVTLANDLHYLRYAPKLSSTEGLQQELIERSRKLARALG